MAGINNYSNLIFDEPGDRENQQRRRSAPVPIISNPRIHTESSHDDREKSVLDNINADQDAITKLNYVKSEGDLSLPLEKHQVLDKFLNGQEDNAPFRKYLVFGVQSVSLVTENMLSHPFIVLRRQCQVHNSSQQYHLHPISLLPSIVHLHRRQGVTTLWKGLGSCLLVRGMTLALDDGISKLTGWPKHVDGRTTLKRFGQHILLKSISIGVVVPFYAASLVRTVQSDMASEKSGILDVLREGCLRLFNWSSPQRMLPTWAIIGPSIWLGITKYLFSLVIHGISSRIMRRRLSLMQEERSGAKYRDDTMDYQNAEIYANLIATLTTEVIFFPFESILHRLQLQGTRTIIDNLDNGTAVVPILTNYLGAIDCYRTTIITEGFSGLYKGFGAMILQFAAHLSVIKLTKFIVFQITKIISNRPSSGIIQYYNLDSNSITLSPSISSTELDVHSVGHNSLD